MVDFELTTTESGLEFSFAQGDALRNNVLLSLLVQRGTLISATWFGSRLHTILYVAPQSVELARDYCQQALRWLIDLQRVVSVEVTVEADTTDFNRMNIRVVPTTPTGMVEAIELHYSVV